MGCGHNKIDGYVNVDLSPACNPDVVWDLEVFPWPWDDDSIDAVRFYHSLEHMGESARAFLGIMKELYRVCRDAAEIEINVPHPRHDCFISDPTHVRIITPGVLSAFDREWNDKCKFIGAANTPLAHYLNVDFKVVSWDAALAEPYISQAKRGELTNETIEIIGRELNNIFEEYRITMMARKGR